MIACGKKSYSHGTRSLRSKENVDKVVLRDDASPTLKLPGDHAIWIKFVFQCEMLEARCGVNFGNADGIVQTNDDPAVDLMPLERKNAVLSSALRCKKPYVLEGLEHLVVVREVEVSQCQPLRHSRREGSFKRKSEVE